MDQVRLLDMLLMLLAGSIGWWAKVIWDNLRQLEKDMRELERGIPKEYVRKSDWDRATDSVNIAILELKVEIGSRLDAIWDKLDDKADK